MLRDYASKVGEPLNQVNEMLLDEDLVSVREELRELRAEYKARAALRTAVEAPRTTALTPLPPRACVAQTDSGGGLFGMLPSNPLRSMADSVGVEWKDWAHERGAGLGIDAVVARRLLLLARALCETLQETPAALCHARAAARGLKSQ